MVYWQKRYQKNSARGFLISISLHLSVTIFIFFISDSSPMEDQNYYHLDIYPVQVTDRRPNESNWGSGGSYGNGINIEGEGTATQKTEVGIPLPSTDSTEIDFGMTTNFKESKDSLSAIGSGMGTGNGTGIGSGSGSGIGDGSGWGVGSKTLPFIPRQILEVLPQNIRDTKGEIILLLKISFDGSVREHKLIYNTTGDQLCLKNTIEAAYKSRWEKIKIEGTKIEYWIEKKYGFDIKNFR